MILHSAARILRLSGYLVDYTTFKGGQPVGKRVTSETRTDSGPGACEVLYIDGFDTVGSPNRAWRITQWIGLAALLLGLLLWLFLPMRVEN